MYRYDEFDQGFVQERVAEFSDQVARRLSGELTEDQFKPLRLMNGVYLQLHAYMLRIAIPYGTLSSRQMRRLAHIARVYDRGYGHFTTRQNLQFNWIKLEETPAILAALAEVEMHAIQTSGNCIRNVTADHFAGAAADEVADPRPYAEILRQWSSLHPEFTYLPRKFKIAVTGSPKDRAAIQVHDIGLEVLRNEQGALGFAVWVGGGQGRTPLIAKKLRSFLPEEDLLVYCEAVLRVYNQDGQRDNKYKARIKILVQEMGEAEMKAAVEAEFALLRGKTLTLPQPEIERIAAYFAPPAFASLPAVSTRLESARRADSALDRFVQRNLSPHKQAGYGIVTLSLKPIGAPPGDATADQMDAVAELAKRFSFDEIRVSHEQNLVLPHVRLDDLPELHAELEAAGLA
ncbi:MAG: nitrite/sulfite reductase, partial [Elsteraceae bacterium]